MGILFKTCLGEILDFRVESEAYDTVDDARKKKNRRYVLFYAVVDRMSLTDGDFVNKLKPGQ